MSNPEQRGLGIRKVAPIGASHTTTVDIIAIHGLDTRSPRTWEYRRRPQDGGGVVNWLSDDDMLPAAIPKARIFTYDWDASCFQDAPVQTLLGHADNLLASVEESCKGRPIIFIASCFGGLVLIEAICRAAQEGSRYRCILFTTAGIVFLATPFCGSDAASQAQWLVTVRGIMGEQASDQLIKDLEAKHTMVYQRAQRFAEIANAESTRLPIYCFFETKKTEVLRKLLSRSIAARLSSRYTYKILVAESSACLVGFPRQGLNATHSGMNKFNGLEDINFKRVIQAVKTLAEQASNKVNQRRKNDYEPHLMVPFGRNEAFVGRESALRRVLERIPPGAQDDNCQRTIIEGLGGVGKTQVALEAAYRLHEMFPNCSIFWVPAVDVITFENAYRAIGLLLGVSGIDNDKADMKALVRAALSQDRAGEWLLIIDNADDLALLSGEIAISDYLPFSRKGSILFTSRNHQVVGQLGIPVRGVFEITEMSRVESVELLTGSLKISQVSSSGSMNSLLDFLADLPLAIKQAAAYIGTTGISVAKYLTYCQSSDKSFIQLLSKDFGDQGRYKSIDNPVATTWLISFQYILRDAPPAAEYLIFISFLAEKGIPRLLLPGREDELEVEEALGTLKAYAFISERTEGKTFDIHRLVRLAMRSWLKDKPEWERWATEVIQRLADAFPFPKHENRKIWLEYLPHAESALAFREAITEKKAVQELLFNAAMSNDLLGKYKEAEQMHRETLGLCEKVLGREHLSTLGSMNNLALVLHKQGKYEEAEQMHREALGLKEKVLGREHLSTLDSMNNLALVLNRQGKYEEAEQMHREELRLCEKVLGREHPSTLGSMNNLATVLNEQGTYEEAEQMHREALGLCEKVLGREHPSTLDSMNNLALVLYKQGTYEEAEQMHREALGLKEKVLGREHPSTLDSINNLATVLNEQGTYEEAEQMHREALGLCEKVLGREHPSTLDSMNNLALVLYKQGTYEEAEQMHREALGLKEKVLGREHPSTLDSMNNLATVLNEQGKYEEAEQIHREALGLKEKVLGREHPSTLDSMNNLALVLYKQGTYEEAEQMHRETLGLKEKVLGREHPSTLNSMNNLATVLNEQGKYEEAEQMHRETLGLKEKVLGREHPSTLGSMNNLALVLYKQGTYEEAEQMHREALGLKEKVLGREHPLTLDSMNNLALVLNKQGTYEEAEQMHRETLGLKEKVLGREHPSTLDSMNNLALVLNRQGKYEEAEQMHREELRLYEKVLGREHPSTLGSMNNLATVLDSQGKYEEAEQLKSL